MEIEHSVDYQHVSTVFFFVCKKKINIVLYNLDLVMNNRRYNKPMSMHKVSQRIRQQIKLLV